MNKRARNADSHGDIDVDLQFLMDSVPVLISYVDQNQVLRHVNQAYEDFFGRPREEIVGRTVRELAGDLHYNVARSHIESALCGKTVIFESQVKRNDGATRDITLTYKPDVQADGSVRGFVAMVQDVTERRRVDAEVLRSEIQFRKIFHDSPLGMALLGSDFRYMQVNPSLCRMLGYTEQELLKQTSLDVTHVDDRGAGVLEALQVFTGDRKDVSVEKRYLTKDGETLWVRVHSSLLHDSQGQPWRNLVLIEDITERKHAETAMAKQARELVRSNSELEQFAYVISHDLQEPLRAISSYSKLLSRQCRGKLDADGEEFLGYLVSGAQRMSMLIRDLLHYSRVTEDVKPAEPVDLNEVLRIALLNLELAIEEADASLALGEMPVVSGRRVQLLQLFQNLIGNALKYRDPERRPDVKVYVERGQKEWRFSIKDNGMGIDAQNHERIFGIFQRLNGKDQTGTGIGLALCRKIVEQHGGHLWVESQLGQGATFNFTLPIFTLASGPS